MYNRVENKIQAKDLLRGDASCILASPIFWKYLLGLIIQVGIAIVVAVLQLIPLIGFLLMLAFMAYSGLAIINFTKVLVETGEIKYNAMFDFVSDWKLLLKALAVIILFGLMVGIGSMFLLIPGIYLSLRYTLAFYCLNDDHTLGVIDCFKKSAELMNGRKLNLLILQISMIGWVILGYITLGIGFIYLTVYMNVILYIFFKMAKEK